jgi:hypothetical protein
LSTKNVKLNAYIPPEHMKALKQEAKERYLRVVDVVKEMLRQRYPTITKESLDRTKP